MIIVEPLQAPGNPEPGVTPIEPEHEPEVEPVEEPEPAEPARERDPASS